MWPLPRVQNEKVIITFDPQAISCSWISTTTKSQTYVLRAYKRINFEQLEAEKLILFNPTHIYSVITDFLTTHSLANAFISFALSGPGIIESIVELPMACPQPKDFAPYNLNKCIWNYYYLFPKKNTLHAFYIGGISRHLLFQYKLLAINCSLNLQQITTRHMSLIHLSRTITTTSFKHGNVIQDRDSYLNQLEQSLTAEVIKNNLQLDSEIKIDINDEAPFLGTALGSIVHGGKNNETN